MAIINASYAVLRDPVKRKEYDATLVIEEALPPYEEHKTTSRYTEEGSAPSSSTSHSPYQAPKNESAFLRVCLLFWKVFSSFSIRGWIFIICVVWFGGTLLVEQIEKSSARRENDDVVRGNNSASGQRDIDRFIAKNRDVKESINLPKEDKYSKPLVAPNGLPWPKQASYLNGIQIKNADGLSSVTIDNSTNAYDVYVKLKVYSGGAIEGGSALREVFIPKYRKFEMENITQGAYLIQYQDLDSGDTYALDKVVQLNEIPMGTSIQYSKVRVTLYTVANGNLRTRKVPRNAF